MPRIEDGLVAAKTPFMLADNLSVLPKHNPCGVNLELDGAANSPGLHAVLVPVKVDQAGPVDRDRLFTKPDERLLQRRQESLFLLKHFPHRQVGVLRMPKLPGAFDRVLLQPGVQLIKVRHFKARLERILAGFLDQILDLTFFPTRSWVQAIGSTI